MKRQSLEFKKETIGKLLKGKIASKEAAGILGCKRLTIYRYLNKVTRSGLDALRDLRHSNNRKLTPRQLSEVLKLKKKGNWRSARKVLEIGQHFRHFHKENSAGLG